uniref:Reverse transcriptase domain-containing protein n=1 Tax=Tanacetum cinerariifolium TaxID=118510 RepID=A0A699L6I3_TANCI|nr:hypothetical protein [Tanacetum cinerariifolium]
MVKNSNLEENLLPVVTMADNRTMAELLRAPTEGGSPSVAKKRTPAFYYHMGRSCGNVLERSTQDVLTIIKNKLKVRNSRSKLIASQVKACDVNSNYEIAKLTHAVNQKISNVTTAMTAMLKQFQATPPLASVKVVEEICVTCGGAHPYYQCLAAGGNTFLEFKDNIQGYVSAAAVNYNQAKKQTISTQDQKPQDKAGSGSGFSSNKSTLKLHLSKNPIQGLFLPKDQSQIHQKSKKKVQGLKVLNSQSLPEGLKLPIDQSSS